MILSKNLSYLKSSLLALCMISEVIRSIKVLSPPICTYFSKVIKLKILLILKNLIYLEISIRYSLSNDFIFYRIISFIFGSFL